MHREIRAEKAEAEYFFNYFEMRDSWLSEVVLDDWVPVRRLTGSEHDALDTSIPSVQINLIKPRKNPSLLDCNLHYKMT